MFYYIYIFLSFLAWLLFLPLIFFLQFHKKYTKSIPARFWLWKNIPSLKNTTNGIWFHACSLGEVNSLKPFISKFREINNNLLITTTTEAGYNSAGNLNIERKFLPFEPLLTLLNISSSKLIVFEAELWFLLFATQKKRNSQTILLSGRITERSYPKYLKFKFLYSQIFKNIDLILAQSYEDQQRFLSLGAKNIKVIGNVKLLKSISNNNLNIQKDREIIVGASTHSGDEIAILNSFKHLNSKKLILVPRHKERFDEVWNLIKDFEKFGFKINRFSESNNFDGDIILIDKFGLLIDIYAKSDIVILGGGFTDGIGGHNPIEPASFKNKIISGKFMFNQKELIKYVSNLLIIDLKDLSSVLQNSHDLKYSEIQQDINFNEIFNLIK